MLLGARKGALASVASAGGVPADKRGGYLKIYLLALMRVRSVARCAFSLCEPSSFVGPGTVGVGMAGRFRLPLLAYR